MLREYKGLWKKCYAKVECYIIVYVYMSGKISKICLILSKLIHYRPKSPLRICLLRISSIFKVPIYLIYAFNNFPKFKSVILSKKLVYIYIYVYNTILSFSNNMHNFCFGWIHWLQNFDFCYIVIYRWIENSDFN